MIKIFAAGAAVVALAAGVSRVSMTSDSVRIGDKTVDAQVLQLHETSGSQILASKGVVESLGGDVEVALDGGRVVTLEPGVRLSRTEEGWKLTTHGRRTISIVVDGKASSVESPAMLVATEDGWTLGGLPINGQALRASVARDVTVAPAALARVAADGDTNGDTGGTNTSTRSRRSHVEDPSVTAEAADDEPVVQDDEDVSPGSKPK